MTRSLLLLLALSLIACTPRGGRGGGGGDDDDAAGVSCSDADTAMQQCFQDSGAGDEFTTLYCPATNLQPGANGYMGPGTDWECIVDAWSYDCSQEGPTQGLADSGDCFVDDGLGDDDDAADDDDDDATGSTGEGTVPCGNDPPEVDVFEVWGVGGNATLAVRVDTVSASTTFDPFVAIYASTDLQSQDQQLAFGDDEFACTFEPPDFACPEAAATSSPTGEWYVVVGSASDNCAGSQGEYSLEVFASGNPTNDYDLVLDDYLSPE